ncbi:unnamed protein product [marine sediment metagenome]|uniref:Uncharacterized protein n=1 Tax=marine sediment metagenome TaxID=412755 RepID=X1C128_9ZZZZ
MFKKVLKTYFLVFGVLFVVNWAVGVARFYWDIFRVVFIAINFPFSLIYLWLENKDSIWWINHFGSLVNDEIGQGILFIFMVFFQSVLVTALIFLFKYWLTCRRQTINSF